MSQSFKRCRLVRHLEKVTGQCKLAYFGHIAGAGKLSALILHEKVGGTSRGRPRRQRVDGFREWTGITGNMW